MIIHKLSSGCYYVPDMNHENCDFACDKLIEHYGKYCFENDDEFDINDYEDEIVNDIEDIDKDNMCWRDQMFTEIHNSFEEMDYEDDEFVGDMTGGLSVYRGVWW